MKLSLPKLVLAAALMATPSVASAQFVENFNAPGAAWESGWLGLNSDLGNYYCQGARGCTSRGNAPNALWAFGNPQIVVNFNPTFGATISTFSLDVGNFTSTNLLFYDINNVLISTQSIAYNPVYSDGTTYSVTSANGISRFEFDGGSVSGNLNIDNVTVGVTSTPEPASIVLLGTGLLGVFGVARRRRARGAAQLA